MNIIKTLFIAAFIFLIGYFLVAELPKLALINKDQKASESSQENIKLDFTKEEQVTVNAILRDKCNDYIVKNSFQNESEADNFLENCLAGKETAKISVINNTLSQATSTNVPKSVLTQDQLITKCNAFMGHAQFASQKDADTFLKNCLAGK